MDDEGQAPRRDKAAERAIYEAGQKQGDPYWQVRRPYETDAQVVERIATELGEKYAQALRAVRP